MKNQKGITLIALVITIIVLLILAGVTISMVVGDNGILSKSSASKAKTERAKIVELARIDVGGQQGENLDSRLRKSELIDILNKYFTNVSEIEDSSNILEETVISKEEYGVYNIKVNEIYNNKFLEDDYNGEYILGFVYNDNVRKYFDSDYISNAFFVISANEGTTIFKNHIQLCVSETVEETGEITKWNKNIENAKSGYLCDYKGNYVLGWGIDEDTGDIYRNSVDLLDISHEIEGKERTGTEIDSLGYIYAKFRDDTKLLIGQIPIAKFAAGNALTKTGENEFQGSLASGDFDGIGMPIERANGVMKRITRDSANEINKINENNRKNNYTLTINSDNDYYFPLYNPLTGGITYSKTINIYEGTYNAMTGAIEPTAPYVEGDSLYGLCDENGRLLKGWQTNPDTGKLMPDPVSNLVLESSEQMILNPQATTKARVIGNINNTQNIQLCFYDKLRI